MSDLFERIYESRGVTVESLTPMKVDYQWDEMVALVNVMKYRLLDESQRIGVMYDPDVDGLMSGYILQDFLTRLNINSYRHMNQNKVHGLKDEAMEWVRREQLTTLFIVDAGSGDADNINELIREGVKVIVLDHHDYEQQPILDGGYIINAVNHLPVKETSGCGVVYRFLEYLGREYDIETNKYEKYVGITILSDICSMRSADNRYFVEKAYEAVGTGHLFKAFDFYGSFSSYFSYKLIPFFNAMIRCNYIDGVLSLTDYFEKRGLQTRLAEYQFVRDEQKERVEKLKEVGELIELDGLVFLIRPPQEQNYKVFNGLVANQLIQQYEMGAIVAEYNPLTNTLEGSFRGYGYGKDVLEQWGITCQGHDEACGVSIPMDRMEDILLNFSQEITRKVKVDLITTSNGLTEDEWMDLAWFNELYGKDLPLVLVQFEDEPVRVVKYMKKKDMFFRGVKVIDFGRDITDGKNIVQPLLNQSSYQLIRR